MPKKDIVSKKFIEPAPFLLFLCNPDRDTNLNTICICFGVNITETCTQKNSNPASMKKGNPSNHKSGLKQLNLTINLNTLCVSLKTACESGRQLENSNYIAKA